MSRLHVQRLDHGVLIAPATDPFVRYFLEAWVPRQYWRPLYRTNAVWIDPVLEELGTYLPQVTYGLHERCVDCWEGNPCREFRQNEAMPRQKEAFHGVRSRDAMGRACFLVFDPTRRFAKLLSAHAAPFSYHYDRELRAWYIEPASIPAVTRALKRVYPWCEACSGGKSCPTWNRLADEGYSIKQHRKQLSHEAASILGITLPSSEKDIQDAFRKMALRFHPDHGGTDEQMKSIIEARNKLLAR